MSAITDAVYKAISQQVEVIVAEEAKAAAARVESRVLAMTTEIAVRVVQRVSVVDPCGPDRVQIVVELRK